MRVCGSNKKISRLYELGVGGLGALSVPFVLLSITFFFAYGSIPDLLLPSLGNPLSFVVLISSLILGLVLHEFSHVVVLANRGVESISIGMSISGIWGGFVKADLSPETYSEIKLPFYSSGLGSNLLIFLLFLPFAKINPYLHIISAVNFWLLVMNAIPAPLMDGGKVFEATFKRLKLEKYMELISAGVLLLWLLIIILRIFSL